MFQSIDDKIIKSISKRGRGTVFSPSEFSNLGEKTAVLKALERMTSAGIVHRVARGIYCYPKTDKEYGLGVILPSYEDIAKAIAKRDKLKIAPTGAYALNMLGLSTQVPMNVVYLTDGSSRKVKISGNRGILFKHTSPRNLAYKSQLAMLVCAALKEIGKDSVTGEQIDKINQLLRGADRVVVTEDLQLMPDWIASIVRKAYQCALE